MTEDQMHTALGAFLLSLFYVVIVPWAQARKKRREQEGEKLPKKKTW